MSAIPLICLPYAGAGATIFRGWEAPGVDVVPFQLPGRQERFDEDPYLAIEAAVAGILPEVCERVADAGRVAIFGHSMGAVLAYELARRIAGGSAIEVVLLAVSGAPAPAAQRRERATGLDDEAFIARMTSFAGYAHPALDDPDMREILLPVLRADIEMHENYVPTPGAPLNVPILALRGHDDHLVSEAQIGQWRGVTSSAFAAVNLSGGHMYLTEQAPRIMRLIGDMLAEQLCVASGTQQ